MTAEQRIRELVAVEVVREVRAERARCAAVCRAMATALDDDTALACAEAIERDAAHVALAAAVRGYLRAVDEPTWDERSLVALDVARTALEAALAAAGGGL